MPAEECICRWHRDRGCTGDSQICDLVAQGLARATELYGNPTIPVNKVGVRLRPCQPPQTVIMNPEQGAFRIYLDCGPEAFRFRGQLAHEVAHLLNARLYDCYVEGFNTVFARRLFTERSWDWTEWEDYLERERCQNTRDAFYAETYFMMRCVSSLAGEEHMRDFLHFAECTDGCQDRMHIHINNWLDPMPTSTKASVKEEILRHEPRVNSLRRAQHMTDYRFVLPDGASSQVDR